MFTSPPIGTSNKHNKLFPKFIILCFLRYRALTCLALLFKNNFSSSWGKFFQFVKSFHVFLFNSSLKLYFSFLALKRAHPEQIKWKEWLKINQYNNSISALLWQSLLSWIMPISLKTGKELTWQVTLFEDYLWTTSTIRWSGKLCS